MKTDKKWKENKATGQWRWKKKEKRKKRHLNILNAAYEKKKKRERKNEIFFLNRQKKKKRKLNIFELWLWYCFDLLGNIRIFFSCSYYEIWRKPLTEDFILGLLIIVIILILNFF